ncbi:MAG: hypothetical protein AAFV53_15075 [Myxococcota bacterium]
MRDVEAVWRAIAGSHPIPAPLLSLLTDTTDAYAVLSDQRVSFGLTGISRGGLDAALRALPHTVDLALVDRIYQQLIEGRGAVDFSVEVEVGGAEPLLHLRADSPHVAADISELKDAIGAAMAWPAGLASTGSVRSWRLSLQGDAVAALELEAPPRAPWLPAEAYDALRDLPEMGTVQVRTSGDAPLQYASRTLIGEDDHAASWEAAQIPLAAYGRMEWAKLGDTTSARPYAVHLDGRDVRLELYASVDTTR